jgi:hypothetical protein
MTKTLTKGDALAKMQRLQQVHAAARELALPRLVVLIDTCQNAITFLFAIRAGA